MYLIFAKEPDILKKNLYFTFFFFYDKIAYLCVYLFKNNSGNYSFDESTKKKEKKDDLP